MLQWIALVIALAVSVSSQAQQTTGASQADREKVTPALPSIPPPDTQPGTHAPSGGLGVVSSISPQRGQIVIRYGTLVTSFLLNDATEITRGGSPASAEDIQPGMQIRATLDTTRTTATRVDIVNQTAQ